MWVMWNLVSVRLEIVLIMPLDKHPVCTEVSEAQKSFWMNRMELLRDVGHVESHFSSFGDGVSVSAR
jgi:hypothetical protein